MHKCYHSKFGVGKIIIYLFIFFGKKLIQQGHIKSLVKKCHL